MRLLSIYIVKTTPVLQYFCSSRSVLLQLPRARIGDSSRLSLLPVQCSKIYNFVYLHFDCLLSLIRVHHFRFSTSAPLYDAVRAARRWEWSLFSLEASNIKNGEGEKTGTQQKKRAIQRQSYAKGLVIANAKLNRKAHWKSWFSTYVVYMCPTSCLLLQSCTQFGVQSLKRLPTAMPFWVSCPRGLRYVPQDARQNGGMSLRLDSE